MDDSYGEIIDRHGMTVRDYARDPEGNVSRIESITLSDGDDAENPDADRVVLETGVEWFRAELYAADEEV